MTVPAMDRRAQLLAARVYLIVTPETLGADAEARVAAALASGAVDLVQARTKRPGRDALDRLAAWLAPLAAAADVPWIVDDDPAAAVRLGADGAHVGEDDMAPAEARAVLGPARFLGVSTHDAEEIARAAAGPGDHAGLGPCFASGTKQLVRPPLGPAAAAAILATAPRTFPVFAIGGIDAEGAARLAEAGVQRVAVGAGILGARDPGAAAAAIRRTLGPV
ncbi:MAG: thiamine phosphate synthase [Planctomycetes bacterium]|nr:thiamine phosphate synthase [Planctomycetota bacterium]MCB9902491.1 thiamine phosphate synthase [Planctomycetota bacterium]